MGRTLDLSKWSMIGLALVAGTLLGAGLYAWWLRARRVPDLLVPDKWPLAARSLLTSQEQAGLKWLAATFDDHLVMVKVPVLRFTVPTHKKQESTAERWQELLNGLYCTYTVCTPQGKVVGCVDLPGKHGLPQATRALKKNCCRTAAWPTRWFWQLICLKVRRCGQLFWARRKKKSACHTRQPAVVTATFRLT